MVFSEIYRMPNLMINFTLTNDMLLGTFLNYAIRLSLIFFSGGLVTGIFLLITFAFSIGAIVQKNHVTGGLVILNWLLVVDALVVLIVGSAPRVVHILQDLRRAHTILSRDLKIIGALEIMLWTLWTSEPARRLGTHLAESLS